MPATSAKAGQAVHDKHSRAKIRNRVITIFTLLAIIIVLFFFLINYKGFNDWERIDTNLTIFVAVNVNIVLLTTVFYMILRNLFKLVYERRKPLAEVTLKTKLIIAFAALVVAGIWLLLTRTRLGLFVRGVTQNRAMASCVGVPTARVDTLAFGLGCAIAGLAGCALSQIGNVGPALGQGYIVDSFMVVVLGGVGQLAGTVYAGLGLGLVNKLLESWSGAVLAKIAVLVFIIIFIQKRPQGLFALKGRAVEA